MGILADYCVSITDGTHSSVTYNEHGSCYLISSKDVRGGSVHLCDQQHILESDLDDLRKRTHLELGDVLLTTMGDIGETAVVQSLNYELQRSIAILKTDRDYLIPEYLALILRSDKYKQIMDNVVSGSVQKHLFLTQIRELPFDCPSLEVQSKILQCVAPLDHKITILNEFNDNLANQIGAYFSEIIKSAEGETIPFGTMAVIGSGGTPKTSVPEYWGGTIPFFSPKDVCGLYVCSTEKYITRSGLDNCNSGYYPKNTTFITARGTVGKVALAGRDMAMNQSCYAIVSLVPGREYYIHQLSLYTANAIKQKSNGAVFDAINAKDITEEPIPDLDPEQIERFGNTVAPLYELIWSNVQEIESLSSLRDFLLARLMSGKIDVSTLELPTKYSFGERMHQLLSQRLNPIKYPDVLEYHKTSQCFINQTIRIVSDMLIDSRITTGYMESSVSDQVCREFFLQTGTEPDAIGTCYGVNNLMKLFHTTKNDVFLDILDLTYQVMYDCLYHTQNPYYNHYVDLQNEIFKRNGIGYRLIEGCLIPIFEEVIHENVTVPTFRLLRDLGYEDASRYLVSAYDRFYHSDNGGAIIEATNALESTINQIMDEHNIEPKGSKNSHKIEALVAAGILPAFENTPVQSLINVINAAHNVRNNTSAHGNGNQNIPDEFFIFVVNSVSSTILFLVSLASSRRND